MKQYPSIAEEINAVAYKECIPLFTTFEITQKCNIRCLHCYNFDRSKSYSAEASRKELTDEDIFHITDELQEAGCLYLAFSGGEALVHSGIYDFIRHARDKNICAGVKSNGTLLNPEVAKKLVQAGTNFIDIALYGAAPQTYDKFTRSSGSFEKVLRGVRAAKASGISVKLTFCLTKFTAGEIEKMIGLADEMGVSYGIDPQITERYDGTSTGDLRIDAQTLKTLYEGPLAHLLSKPNFNSTSVQCSCARSVCGVSAYGEVYPCIGAPMPSGNLREKSFKEIWATSPELNKIRGLRLDDFIACKPCPHRPYCRRSSGVIYANTSNYTGPDKFGDDWTCMEAEVIHSIHENRDSDHFPANGGELKRHSIM